MLEADKTSLPRHFSSAADFRVNLRACRKRVRTFGTADR